MGRRRRRVVRIVKKKLPTVFTCPRCGEEAVRVTIDKQTGHATVLCALCQLKDEFPAHPAAQMIDVYSYFTDRFYGVKDPRAIIPREREHLTAPSEPEESSLEISGEESTAIEVVPETSLAEIPTNPVPDVSPHEPVEASPPSAQSFEEESLPPDTTQAEENVQSQGAEEEKAEAEEESDPFADIMQENKDKKRYSPNPLPQESSEAN